MTALGPSEVFISNAFKTLNLRKPDFFSPRQHASFLPPALTAQMVRCSARPPPPTHHHHRHHAACPVSFTGSREADPALEHMMDATCAPTNHR